VQHIFTTTKEKNKLSNNGALGAMNAGSHQTQLNSKPSLDNSKELAELSTASGSETTSESSAVIRIVETCIIFALGVSCL